LIDTGNINTDTLLAPGVELAANFQNVYVQGEHIWYQFERELSALPDPDFSGWYVQAAWALTGETRAWNPTTGTFSGLRPAKPLDLKGDGWGALELAARYSVSDLNYREDLLPPAGGTRGGGQTAVTLGLNWYVNNNVPSCWTTSGRGRSAQHRRRKCLRNRRFRAARGAQTGQDLEIVSIRTQFTF
jgi:phosphate-selective porin OprO/OprP